MVSADNPLMGTSPTSFISLVSFIVKLQRRSAISESEP